MHGISHSSFSYARKEEWVFFLFLNTLYYNFAFVCYHLCADHTTHGQPVVRRMLLPGGVQDVTGTAFAQETLQD